MRRTNTQPLKEVIHEYVEALKMKSKLKEVGVVSSWEKIVGRTVAKATREIYIKDQKLFVKIQSSVVKNELLMIKEPLIKRLNEHGQGNIITDIVIY